ncbi:DUF3927 family protein [Nissabacter sp. SGAir0207]|uniref:DUF3927 family protein n=1 Tax=Nissabacter sp. SGAir0207 TaxID=2126321 RepID=UPI001F0FA611|nr:DUF3927 family protein [Nissabacter sp. SGAir0207]
MIGRLYWVAFAGLLLLSVIADFTNRLFSFVTDGLLVALVVVMLTRFYQRRPR